MHQDIGRIEFDLCTPYSAKAIFYEDADCVEYVRTDSPCIYRRVDEILTLAYDMFDREKLVGFQLKGFKNFYLKNIKPSQLDPDFLPLSNAIEKAVTLIGDLAISPVRKSAYTEALKLASVDGAVLLELPSRRAAI